LYDAKKAILQSFCFTGFISCELFIGIFNLSSKPSSLIGLEFLIITASCYSWPYDVFSSVSQSDNKCLGGFIDRCEYSFVYFVYDCIFMPAQNAEIYLDIMLLPLM